jgi:MFS family permease
VVFALTVREPKRTGRIPAEDRPPRNPGSLFADLAFLFRSPAYLFLLAASTFMGLNVFAASVWTPTFLERVHGLSMGSVASIIGPIRGIFGLAGVLIGGFTIDRLMRRSPHWRVTLPALACLLLAPVEVLFLLASEQWLWMAAFAGSAFLTLIHQGPLFALVMEVAPSRMRALAIATLVLFSGLLGQAAGPLIVGMANDALAPTMGDTAIRYSMLIIAVTALLAGLMIMLSRRHLEHIRTARG